MGEVQTKEYLIPIYIEPQNVKFHGEGDSRYVTLHAMNTPRTLLDRGRSSLKELNTVVFSLGKHNLFEYTLITKILMSMSTH